MAVWTLVALVGGIVCAAIAKSHGVDVPEDEWSAVALVLGIGTPACVGLVLLLRRPDTTVAWILLAGALSVATVMVAFTVSGLALDEDPDSALGAWAQVVASEWTVLFLWPLALAYVFPDGRLPSRRWRPMAWIAAVSGIGTLLLLPLQPTFESVRSGRSTTRSASALASRICSHRCSGPAGSACSPR